MKVLFGEISERFLTHRRSMHLQMQYKLRAKSRESRDRLLGSCLDIRRAKPVEVWRSISVSNSAPAVHA